MPAISRTLGLLLASSLLSSCVIFAGKSDYADYREVRLATDPGARALAMRSYVDRNPNGHWHDEVDAERKRVEVAVFEAGRDSRTGLEHYLAAYPDGTFVAQARGRLRAIGLIEQQRKQALVQTEQLAEARKLRAEELRRTWIGRFLGYWVKTLTELHGWGEPIAEVARQNLQFSRAFGALPRPRCTQDDCVKYYASEYAVPVPGGNRIERTLTLLLRLRMRAGKLERAELLLPERGFTQWYELENRRAVNNADHDSRVAAMQWAIERALPTVTSLGDAWVAAPATPALPLPTIERPSVGPTGELVDTSIEAPTDPQNRVEDNAGIGVNAGPRKGADAADSVKPTAPQAAPDMKFEALGVDRQGRREEVAPAQPTPAPTDSSGAATELLFTAPIEVPKTAGASAAQPTAAEPPASTSVEIAPIVKVFTGPGLRVTLFAAGSEGPGYDGFVLERIPAKVKRVAAPVPPTTGAAGAPAVPAKPSTPPAQAPAAPPTAPTP